jgi:hypothetical protein
MLAALGLPGDLIHAAATVAGELAANAFSHALDAQQRHAVLPGLPELWIHLGEHPEPHLVISVFDADRDHEPSMAPPAALEESGRCSRIGAAVSAQRGCHPTRSRLGPWHVPGKAMWVALPLPAAWPPSHPALPRPTPQAAAELLHTELESRGIGPVYRNGDSRLQVISVRAGLTVWVGQTIHWQNDTGGYTHRHLSDVSDAVEYIIARHEALGLPMRPDLPRIRTNAPRKPHLPVPARQLYP